MTATFFSATMQLQPCCMCVGCYTPCLPCSSDPRWCPGERAVLARFIRAKSLFVPAVAGRIARFVGDQRLYGAIASTCVDARAGLVGPLSTQRDSRNLRPWLKMQIKYGQPWVPLATLSLPRHGVLMLQGRAPGCAAHYRVLVLVARRRSRPEGTVYDAISAFAADGTPSLAALHVAVPCRVVVAQRMRQRTAVLGGRTFEVITVAADTGVGPPTFLEFRSRAVTAAALALPRSPCTWCVWPQCQAALAARLCKK